MPRCPKCGKELKTPQGLRGHLNFFHGEARQTEEVLRIKRQIEDYKKAKKIFDQKNFE